MTSPSVRQDRGQNSESIIEAARQAGKAALRRKKPKLTSLERAFYEKYKAEREASKSLLIQVKRSGRSRTKAA